ncbi:MAG: cytochrome c oxidase subunit 3 [Deltaproteobacteria bacterium]|nr:cytochrome c oxidase subunit 3 [Deltaproteobacteria bacterium]
MAHSEHETRVFTEQPIGRVGMWWFLASEVMVFGGLLGSYILSRIAAGGWAAETAHVNTRIAAINTLILVTSSLTIVQAHAAVEAEEHTRARKYLLITVLLGLGFLCIKGFEYSIELGHGFTPASGLFWSYYYTMTGLHGLHVFAGVVVNFVLFLLAGGRRWAAVKQRVEYAGLYWHFVDVVWIFLFPLLYLA